MPRGPRRKELGGQKFGRLTVLALSWVGSHRRTHWLCQCDCGNKKEVRAENLKSGKSTSCGCYHAEIIKRGAKFKHGLSHQPIWKAWHSMISRCSNHNHSQYKNYGARGITVCERWLEFDNFYKDMAPTWRHGLSIDRMDNYGNYEPSNCRWATVLEQNRNTRRAHYVDTPWGRMNVTSAAQIVGVNKETARQRFLRG